MSSRLTSLLPFPSLRLGHLPPVPATGIEGAGFRTAHPFAPYPRYCTEEEWKNREEEMLRGLYAEE